MSPQQYSPSAQGNGTILWLKTTPDFTALISTTRISQNSLPVASSSRCRSQWFPDPGKLASAVTGLQQLKKRLSGKQVWPIELLRWCCLEELIPSRLLIVSPCFTASGFSVCSSALFWFKTTSGTFPKLCPTHGLLRWL